MKRAFAAVAVLVGASYLWFATAAGDPFLFRHSDLPGYYNYLGRAFVAGQLHLPVEPSPELLALPNPWDAKQNEPYRMHDLVLFDGRYYLYHGATPGALLFAPWRMVTGYDLPENFALALICFTGFLLWSAALALEAPRAGALLFAALGWSQCIPFLLNRTWAYEIAIGSGYTAIGAGVLAYVLAQRAPRPAGWFAAAGFCFALAVGCRPHLGLVGAIVALPLVRHPRRLVAFAVPFAAVCALIGWYNWARFGNPLEFGIRYLLALDSLHQQVTFRPGNMVPSLYYMLLCPPEFSGVFPWVRAVNRLPVGAATYHFLPGYFREPIAGALWIAPFIVLARPGVLFAAAAAVLVFVAGTGFATQRYLCDFLPLLVFLAAVTIARLNSKALRVAAGVAIVYSILANLALGLAGPYDNIVRNRPAEYLRWASWFSPLERYRAVLNPPVDITFDVEPPEGARRGEPLVTMGRVAHRYFLFVEPAGEKWRFVSTSGPSLLMYEAPPAPRYRVRLRYSPETHNITVDIDGATVMEHEIGMLVTAPSDITLGENRIDPFVTIRRFRGRITPVEAQSLDRTP